jgi:MCP family monocarboxylic acid transporter-like MFS transporter 10
MFRQADVIEKRPSSDASSTKEPSIAFPPSLDEESSSASNSAESDIIEGGLRAWLTVIGSSLAYFASFGIINSFGFFQDYYEKTLLLGVPASTISFVGTIQLTLMNLLAAPAGSLFDCYGLKVLVQSPSNMLR